MIQITSELEQNILNSLAERDAEQSDTFRKTFKQYQDLLRIHHLNFKTLTYLKTELDSLKIEHEKINQELKKALENGSPENIAKMLELEQTVVMMKDERSDLYKKQANNTQKILEMVESDKVQQEKIKELEYALTEKISTINKLTIKVQDQTDLIKEKDGVIQILRDELTTHQLELTQKDARVKELETKIQILEGENKQLLERWIQSKQEEAAKMNEANEYVESALKSKRLSPFSFFGKLTSSISMASTADATNIEPEPVLEKNVVLCVVPNSIMKRLSIHNDDITCMAVSHNGTFLASGSSDKIVNLMDSTTGTVKHTFSGANQGIMCVDFSSNDSSVLASSNDNSTRIWQVSTGRLLHTLTGHVGKVYAARFSESDKQVVSASHDRTIKVWDLARGLKTIFTLSSCNDLCVLDVHGHTIASGHLDNNIRFWDTRSENLIYEMVGVHSGQITSIKTAPARNMILSTSRDNTIKLIDTRNYEVVQTFSDPAFRVGMNWSSSCFSPDGMFVSSGSVNGNVLIWNTNTGTLETTLSGHRSPVCSVCWNPNGGGFVYSAEKDKSIVLWQENNEI